MMTIFKRHCFFFFLLLTCVSPAFADDGKYLKYQRLLAIENDSIKCAELMRYADALTDSLNDYDFALLIFQKVNTTLDQSRYPSLQLDLYRKWAFTNYKARNYEEADRLFVKALSLPQIEQQAAIKANTLNAAGSNLQSLLIYKRALVYFHEALAIYVKLNNAKGKGTVYLNMANIFALSGDLAESNRFFDKASALFLQEKLMEHYVTTIANKAYVKLYLGYPDSAKLYMLRAIGVKLTHIDNPENLVGRYVNLGAIYAEIKQWDSSFFYLQKGQMVADSMGIGSSNEASYEYHMGYTYYLKGDYKKSINHYKKALTIKSGIAEYGTLYSNMAASYLADKQYDSAFAYKHKSIELADSIYKSELKQHIAFENKRVELLEKDHANEIQSSLQKQSLHELRNRNYLFAIIITLLIAFLILLFLYFRQYRIRIKKEHLQSELDFLKAQLNPHFLFNSINNIYVLLDENKEKASEILLKFSSLMRYQLYECNVSTIQLNKEFHFLEDYIAFEKLRYAEKIGVHYHFDHTGADQLLIAPLLLQPFIENAFKHIPKSRQEQGQIIISGRITDNILLFEVTNTVNTSHVSTLPGGIGLGNVRKRLSLLYFNKHELHTLIEDNLFKISLKVTLVHA